MTTLAFIFGCCTDKVKAMMEVWGMADTYEALTEATRLNLPAGAELHMSEGVSWAVFVEAYGKSLNVGAQEAARSHLHHLPFKGPVKCKEPDRCFWLVERHRANADGIITPASVAERVYLCREVAVSARKRLLAKGSLKRRVYLGPTSMDNELSLVMANMALVKAGSLVIDPFVGTGSILVACATFGAFCVGTDIDVRVLRGKQGSNMFSNFAQYGLPAPEVVRCDASRYAAHFRHGPNGVYDGVVCDPPYGIRAGARKSGSKRGAGEVKEVPPELRAGHVPQTQVRSRPMPFGG
jgi:tRNA (guanine10-N2)-methyltransferase